MKRLVASLAAALAIAASSANAAGLAPQGRSVDLGALKGVAYYTVTDGNYNVVVTVADQESNAIRFEAKLAEGQSVVLSSAASGEAVKVQLSRRNGELRIDNVSPAL